jgi:integrase
VYWIKFAHQGKRYYTSSKSERKRDAEHLLAMYLGEIASGTFKGLKTSRPAWSLRELLDDFEQDCTERKLRGVNRILSHLKPVRAYFAGRAVAEVTTQEVERYKKHRRTVIKYGGKGTVSDATINREVQYLGQALRFAQERELIERLPRIKKYRETHVRQGFFTKAEFDRLVAFLPEDLKDFVRFGYYSGWRKGEISRIEWRDVQDTVIRLRPEVSKNKDGRVLVLMGEVAAIMARRRAAQDAASPYVFHRQGRPVKDFRKAWRTACRKAGMPAGAPQGRVFHDLRRTTARNLSRADVPDRIAMAMMGHKTRAMYDRYNIVDEEDIRRGMRRAEDYITAQGDNRVTRSEQRQE